MTLEELKAQHPALYAEVTGLGVAQEKDRVSAHLTLGSASPKHLTIAVKAIKSGEGMTATVQAEYMLAAMVTKEVENRTEDDENIGNINPGEGKDNEDIVAELVAAEMGEVN